ncbi:uncharacterized protein LOC133520797 [Cydia pomonella]|uniref:uncharacterized protein LOC133520797 n=1 Tax=Cydia pomonella TaxID=82600 RepID=UPI002ADD427E|nr:uncharacterized protein LOC133520797 [Cydia pomonella]
MMKIVVLVALVHLACANPLLEKTSNGNRHKRLLFYDEQGNLIQTYNSPIRDFPEQIEKFPFFGSFFQPFYNFIRPIQSFGGRPMTYMIPVSDEVIHQIAQDPIMQNKLLLLPRDPIVEKNDLCLGKRAQIPSPKLCSAFLNCWDGFAFEQECPSGLLFSGEGYCDYPQRVDCVVNCGNATLSNEQANRSMSFFFVYMPSSSDIYRRKTTLLKFKTSMCLVIYSNIFWFAKERPAPAPVRCASDFEAFRSEWSCGEFFVCVNRLPVRFQCPNDLVFNTELGICDYPARVNCSASVNMSGAAEGGTASTDGKTVLMRSSIYNTQSWSSHSHVALSRQDAVRQLQLGRIANINTAY